MPQETLDSATIKIANGQAILAMWNYILDTSDDENYPFVSYGQLLLREDGAVFQRVHHSGSGYDSWGAALRAQGGHAHTIADVERMFSSTDCSSNYSISRITLLVPQVHDFAEEYHSDVDGDRYVIVDADDFDLTGWSVEVGQTEQWLQRNSWRPADWTARREFSRTHPWYRSQKGTPWGYLRFSRDEVDYPWSTLVDHGEYIVQWIPPSET